MTKRFISFPDTLSIKKVPQGIQHKIIGDMAKSVGAAVDFYLMENTLTVKSNQILLKKIHSNPKIDGFIFLNLDQLFTSIDQGKKVIQKILRKGWEVHFSIENISFYSIDDFNQIYPLLYAKFYTDEREKEGTFFKEIIERTKID